MSERADGDFLRDIQEAVRQIQAYTDAMAYGRFLEDIKTQDAVVRNLEIIGEATKKLSAQLRVKYPDVPWTGAYRSRRFQVAHRTLVGVAGLLGAILPWGLMYSNQLANRRTSRA